MFDYAGKTNEKLEWLHKILSTESKLERSVIMVKLTEILAEEIKICTEKLRTDKELKSNNGIEKKNNHSGYPQIPIETKQVTQEVQEFQKETVANTDKKR
ncbi:MAG: hypothetical protein Ta2E_10640 [Mycoplasmoidaceae bacterium]|nr:MAG: hypothetical protein Ta2E_10640 [Mycoplasmoidaceae bacterium]